MIFLFFFKYLYTKIGLSNVLRESGTNMNKLWISYILPLLLANYLRKDFFSYRFDLIRFG